MNLDPTTVQTMETIGGILLGIAVKWGHGLWVTKLHQFRTTIDDIDNASNNPAQADPNKIISDVKALIPAAQRL